MAKKKAARAGAEPASSKRLRRKLEKLEARLASASDKRDRAQARVDALVIMADEVRASLATTESPTSLPDAPAPPAPTPKAPATAKAPVTMAATPKPAATTRTRRTTRSSSAGRATRATSSRSTSTRTRRRPPAGGTGPAGGSA